TRWQSVALGSRRREPSLWRASTPWAAVPSPRARRSAGASRGSPSRQPRPSWGSCWSAPRSVAGVADRRTLVAEHSFLAGLSSPKRPPAVVLASNCGVFARVFHPEFPLSPWPAVLPPFRAPTLHLG